MGAPPSFFVPEPIFLPGSVRISPILRIFENHSQNPPHALDTSDIIAGLLSHDERTTRTFFYGTESWSFRPNLLKMLWSVFHGRVSYDEGVGELYAYLLADGGRRLRSYDASKSSFWYWMTTVSIRFFLDRRDGLIDSGNDDPIGNSETREDSEHIIEQARPRRRMTEPHDGGMEAGEARGDIQRLLFRMPNKRYAYVLQQLLLLDVEPKVLAQKMGIEVSNLYNIRKRAYEQLEQTALQDKAKYETHNKY